MISGLTFRSLIYFEFIFYMLENVLVHYFTFSYPVFSAVQFSQFLLKRLFFFLHCIVLPPSL